MTNPILSRRSVLAGTAAAGAVPFIIPTLAATPDGLIEDRAQLLPIMRKIRYAADGRLVIWWLRVVSLGNVNARLTPLFTHEVASFHATRDRNDGGFESTSLEIVFSSDVETGEFVEEWYNPYTDEMVPASRGAVGPTTIVHTAKETILPAALPGVTFDSETKLGPAFVANDQIWLRDDISTTVSYDEAGKADFFVNDMSIYHGQMTEIEDPSVAMPRTTNSFESVTSWPAYMNMGNQLGSKLGRGHGEKVANVDEIPEHIRALLDRFHPDIMADPLAALTKEPDPFYQ